MTTMKGFTTAKMMSSTIVIVQLLLTLFVTNNNGVVFTQAFITTSTPSLVQSISFTSSYATTTTTTTTTALFATSPSSLPDKDMYQTGELFKAGLLANLEEEAAILASKKIRSVKDLGWTDPIAKRRGTTRPRHWAFGGSDEKPIQYKPNYDETSINVVEKWVSLPEFYILMKDDTAIADTIFVALAGGGAFIEREVAEQVIAKWRRQGTVGRKRGGGSSSKNTFDTTAFLQTVQEGRIQFLAGWAVFLGFTGTCVLGIIFPTNPIQMALVNVLEASFHNDAKLAEMSEIVALSQTLLL